MNEKWKPVVGWYGFYEVSDLGRVRSVEHMTRRGRRGGKVLSPVKTVHGYLTVVLSAHGKVKRATVHSLVLEAFVGPRPALADACHWPDIDRANCRLENLRWDTRRGNFADKVRHGTQTRGETHPVSKLTKQEVLQAKRLREKGLTYRQIAEQIGTTPSNIHLIVIGRNWRHVA